MIFNGILTGQRLYLRALGDGDATVEYCAWLNDPEVTRFLSTKHATIEELQTYIEQKSVQSDCFFMGMFLKDSGKHIGTIKLEPIDIPGKRATIALMVGDKNYWGQGYGPESMQLLIDYCFNELHLEEVNLGVRSNNTPAIRSYQKLGFIETAREKDAIHDGEIVSDQVTMVLRRT